MMLLVFWLVQWGQAEGVLSRVNGDVRFGAMGAALQKVVNPQRLASSVQLETGENSMARLDLGNDLGVVLLPNSRLEMPVTGTDRVPPDRMILRRGRVRVESNLASFRVETTTAVADVMRGFVVVRVSPTGSTEMAVLVGKGSLKGVGQPEDNVVESGKRLSFQAQMQEGVPLFDELLQGRRVVRGSTSELPALTPQELEDLTKETAYEAPKKKVIVAKQQISLCKSPPAQLNQCAWMCEGPLRKQICAVEMGAQCVRKRCAASGEWKDPYVLPHSQNRCGKTPLVRACDY